MCDKNMNLLLQPGEDGDVSHKKEMIFLAARRYLDAPYLHQGRGVGGFDCLGLLLQVARDVGQDFSAWDRTDYGWRPEPQPLMAALEQHLLPCAQPAPGDVALFRLQGNPQHLGIFSQLPDGRLGLIHAYAPIGRVVEHGYGGPWPLRLHAAYSLSL